MISVNLAVPNLLSELSFLTNTWLTWYQGTAEAWGRD